MLFFEFVVVLFEILGGNVLRVRAQGKLDASIGFVQISTTLRFLCQFEIDSNQARDGLPALALDSDADTLDHRERLLVQLGGRFQITLLARLLRLLQRFAELDDGGLALDSLLRRDLPG